MWALRVGFTDPERSWLRWHGMSSTHDLLVSRLPDNTVADASVGASQAEDFFTIEGALRSECSGTDGGFVVRPDSPGEATLRFPNIRGLGGMTTMVLHVVASKDAVAEVAVSRYGTQTSTIAQQLYLTAGATRLSVILDRLAKRRVSSFAGASSMVAWALTG